MIAQAYLNEWAARAPWPQQAQIEQDLVLSRLIVEIAHHELLGEELAFRGGTCLHKLHLPKQLRYSEDLDYVRRTHSGIKPYLSALRDLAVGIGLIEHATNQSGQMVHIVFDAEPTDAVGRIRVKIAAYGRGACPLRAATGEISASAAPRISRAWSSVSRETFSGGSRRTTQSPRPPSSTIRPRSIA